MENPDKLVTDGVGYPVLKTGPPLSVLQPSDKPVTLGSMLGLKTGARMPGLLRLLKGDAPISEVVAATKSWMRHPVGAGLMNPSVGVDIPDEDDPKVELPPAPVDTFLKAHPVVATLDSVKEVPPPGPLDGGVSQVHALDGIWDTADLNVHAAKTGEGKIDTLRTGERWYDKYIVRNKVAAGGFPLSEPGRAHFGTFSTAGGILSCGNHLGSFLPDVRALLVSRYDGLYGYALGKTLVSEMGEQSSTFAAAAFAAELGYDIPDVEEVVNAWGPFGYVEAVPFNNLRWGSRGRIDRLLLEGLVLVKISTQRASPLVFGHMGGCLEITLRGHPSGPSTDIPGSAMVGRSVELIQGIEVCRPPEDELVPSIIVPPDLTFTSVLDVESSMSRVSLVRDGRAWRVETPTLLPVGRYLVRHTKLPTTDGRVKACVVDWLSSTWLSASARMTYLAARDPQWCSMVRPAWAHAVDMYETEGEVYWYMACHRASTFSRIKWEGRRVSQPGVVLRTDGVYGPRMSLRVYGGSTVLSVFGGATNFKARTQGRVRDRWLGHAFRQWLMIHGGCSWIDSTMSSVYRDMVTSYNPTRAVSYDGIMGHLSALGAMIRSASLTEHVCSYGGNCADAPMSCFCRQPQEVDKALVPRLDHTGKYTAALPLTGNGLLYASYDRIYHPASHGVRPSYYGDVPYGQGDTWVLPMKTIREGVDVQACSDLDCYAWERQVKRKVHARGYDEKRSQECEEILMLTSATRCKRVRTDERDVQALPTSLPDLVPE